VAQTDYGFTGQREEAGFGLYDYNARYYDPYLNRFVSPDTIVPDPANPQSWNRYSYVYNNPLRYVDPTGHDPGWLGAAFWVLASVVLGNHTAPNDPAVDYSRRDGNESVPDPGHMTEWLVGKMVGNAQSVEAESIRALIDKEGFTLIEDNAANQAWTALVDTGNVWDYKVELEGSSWYADGTRDVTLGGMTLNYDAVANIHYGFVGGAIGFDSDYLRQAAGIAQSLRWLGSIFDPNEKGSWHNEPWGNPYGDHPFATWSLVLGMFLYDEYGLDMDEDDFATGIDLFIDTYGEPPEPPPGALAP
jgi:RHS repeat-associated protein